MTAKVNGDLLIINFKYLYNDIVSAIKFLIAEGKINTYTEPQIEEAAWQVQCSSCRHLLKVANGHVCDEWKEEVWFSYENMINLLQPFLDSTTTPAFEVN